MLKRQNFTRSILFFFGLAAILFAAAVPSADYAVFLLGANAKDLSFGPALFRVLMVFHGILLVGYFLFLRKRTMIVEKPENRELSLNYSTRIVLIILTFVALGLRFWNLNTDLWTDEVFTLLDFARQPFGEIVTSFSSQNQHLLYSLLAHASLEIFGESAWSLRLPAVLFGAASVWAMFLLSRKLLGNFEAILAATLLTVSYHHIWFSQNARGYTGLLFFTLLATWFWLVALENNEWRWWLGYAATIIFGMWVHITMAFVVASHALVFLLFLFLPNSNAAEQPSPERRATYKPFAAWLLSASVTLQIYALALPEFLSEGLHEESRNSVWTNPLWVLTETLHNLSIGFAGIAVVSIGAAFVAFGWWRLFKTNRRAAFLIILPPLLAVSVMLVLGHNLFPRFFFFAMGFGLIIVVHGAIELPKVLLKVQNPAFQTARPLGFALVLLMIAASLLTVPRNYALPKQNFSGAKDYVENYQQPNEKIVAVGIAGEIYGRYFAPNWSVARSETELENYERGGAEVWLIYTLSPEIKAFRPEMWRVIERDYKIVRVFPGTLNGGEIFVCRHRSTIEVNNESTRNFGN